MAVTAGAEVEGMEVEDLAEATEAGSVGRHITVGALGQGIAGEPTLAECARLIRFLCVYSRLERR